MNDDKWEDADGLALAEWFSALPVEAACKADFWITYTLPGRKILKELVDEQKEADRVDER